MLGRSFYIGDKDSVTVREIESYIEEFTSAVGICEGQTKVDKAIKYTEANSIS